MANNRPARYFGITTDLSGSIGTGLIANGMQWNESVETAEARDEKGTLLDIAPYSKTGEVSINGLYVGTGVQVGTKVTIGGKDMLISQSNHSENNTEFQQGEITARYGDDDCVIHTLSGIQNGTND